MKRLYFFLDKTNNLLKTEDILCDKDVLNGEIDLNNYEWIIYDSTRTVLERKPFRNLDLARKEVKQELIKYGAKIEREHRKYKI